MKLYIASTSSFAGKTLLALALGTIWREAGVKVGYVKPLGKIPVMREGRLVDGDAMFLAEALALDAAPEAVCPVVITQDLVMAAWRGEELRLRGRISAAVHDAEARSEVLLVGGAANLRDGIFLGLSPLEFIVNYDCRVVLMDRFDGETSMDQVLSAAEALGPRFLGVVFNRVQPVREKFVREGLEAALNHARPQKKRSKVLDGAAEARLVQLACSEAPDGLERWTLQMLADKLIELEVVATVSRETVRTTLKKMNSSRG